MSDKLPACRGLSQTAAPEVSDKLAACRTFSEDITMKRYSAILLTTLIIALGVVAQAQNKGEVLIKNATVMTASHGVIENGSILIRDGKIAAVGKNGEVKAGPNAKVIDATGMYLTPGIIDAHSHPAPDELNQGPVA